MKIPLTIHGGGDETIQSSRSTALQEKFLLILAAAKPGQVIALNRGLYDCRADAPRAALAWIAAGAKTYFRKPGSAAAYRAAWYRRHRVLVRDWRYLKALRERELPDAGLEHA